jgi:hypothetical protein
VPTLRVLSVDARAFGRDRAGLAAVISSAEPDAVCLHNGPHLGRWRNKTAALARRSGRVVVATGGRRSGANTLLSTLALDSGRTGAARLTDAGGTTPPGAALAALRAGAHELLLVSATLIGNAAERLDQARELRSAIDGLVPGRPPAIVSALGSDRPGTGAWQSLADRGVAVAGRFFVDARIDVHEAREIGGTPAAPAVLAVLGL